MVPGFWFPRDIHDQNFSTERSTWWLQDDGILLGRTVLRSYKVGEGDLIWAVQHSMVTIRSTIPGARTMNLQHVRGADHKCYSGHDLGNQDAAGETRYLPYAPGYFDQKPE